MLYIVFNLIGLDDKIVKIRLIFFVITKKLHISNTCVLYPISQKEFTTVIFFIVPFKIIKIKVLEFLNIEKPIELLNMFINKNAR